jgi:hypothetical protein
MPFARPHFKPFRAKKVPLDRKIGKLACVRNWIGTVEYYLAAEKYRKEHDCGNHPKKSLCRREGEQTMRLQFQNFATYAATSQKASFPKTHR